MTQPADRCRRLGPEDTVPDNDDLLSRLEVRSQGDCVVD